MKKAMPIATNLEVIPHSSGGFLSKPVPRISAENTLCNRIKEFLYTRFVGCSRETLERAKFALQLFEIYCGNNDITIELLGGFPAWLESKRNQKVSTIAKNVGIVRSFFKWARERRYTAEDMALFVPYIRQPSKPPPLTFLPEEYEALKAKSEGTHLRWAFICAYHTGMALVDVCHLRWECINLDTMMIQIVRIKMKRFNEKATCWIPIITGSELHEELLRKRAEIGNEIRREDDPGYVDPQLAELYRNNPFQLKMSISRLMKKCAPRKCFITFRRTLISNLANSGMNLTLACKISGHSDTNTFMKYVRPDETALRAGMEQAFEYAKSKTQSPKKFIIQVKPDRPRDSVRENEPNKTKQKKQRQEKDHR